jgi:hypothetical protein
MPNNPLHIESAARMNKMISGSCFSLLILVIMSPDLKQMYVQCIYVNGKLAIQFHDRLDDSSLSIVGSHGYKYIAIIPLPPSYDIYMIGFAMATE